MKYDIQFTNQFKKDLKLSKKQNKKLPCQKYIPISMEAGNPILFL